MDQFVIIIIRGHYTVDTDTSKTILNETTTPEYD